jgi:glycosyltransferase involved in cell wall biosynthesis
MSLYVVAPRSRRIQAAHEHSLNIVDGDVSLIRSGKLPKDADGAIVMLSGETLLCGTRAAIRHRLRTPGIRSMVLVHYPAVPQLDLDLIVLQPRCFSACRPGAGEGASAQIAQTYEEIDFDTRIAAPADPDRSLLFALRDYRQPWALLSLAALEAPKDPVGAMDRLKRLWQREDLNPLFRSLVLRNLIVLMIQHGEHDRARQLLDLGMEAFPKYAELRWLSGAHWLIRQKLTAAKHDGERAVALAASPAWIGSGGENSYRAMWLVGACHAFVGSQEGAVNQFIPGLAARPAFRPSVEGVLKMRLPAHHVERLAMQLCRLVRRETEYLNAVFDYFLQHRCFDVAEHLIDSLMLDQATDAMLRKRLSEAEAPYQPSFSGATDDAACTGVVLQTAFWQPSSLGRIGRVLAHGLLDRPEFDVALEPHAMGSCAPQEFVGGERLSQAMLHQPRQLDLTVRMCWPPDFRRPSRGRLVSIFPWEYCGVPRHWIRQMQENVDQVWTPSRWVAGVLQSAGLDRERIRVIPNGVDTGTFAPEGPVVSNAEARGFVFLYVGGAISRKGFDLLLDAYEEAFNSRDDVTLWIKEFGSAAFYAHNSMLSLTRRFAPGSRAPHLILNTDTVDDATLAGLYRRADCLVHPYRGEGFGMPLAEAMACGRPVITTALGPASEFCSEETGWMISATTGLVPDDPPPVGELSEPLKWFEPRFDELVRAMRFAYENRKEVKRRGAEAARRIRRSHAWPIIIEQYAEAIREVVGELVPA